jgi:parvulin-like peptidyl-prolyl isomerase
MKKPTVAILVLLVSLSIISGCASKNDFAVKVNDQPVAREKYEKKLNAYKSYMSQQGVNFDTEEGKKNLESIKNKVLEGLISDELIRQEVVKNKWNTDDPAVAKQIETLKNQLPNKDYQAWLDQQAMDNEDIVNYFTFTNNVGKDVTVSAEEVQSYFQANYSQYGGQNEQVKARHILVETEEEAVAIIKQVMSGADFAELAKEKSTDTDSKNSGGDLGYFSKGDMVAEFEQAAFSQPVGKVSEKPVKTKFGYHIILVEDHKQAVKPDFNTVAEAVKKDAVEYAQNQKIQSYYSELRNKAKIEYAEDLKPAE